MNKSNLFNYYLLFLFGGITLFLIINHEPWRDEAQAWLLAKDVPNLVTLLSVIKYEGTPALWHVLLFPLAKLGFPYPIMAFFHLLITLAAMFIFLKFAPFNKTIKSLFIFGYFILYEYNVLARNYAISVLLLFLLATLYRQKYETIFYPMFIFLLANANINSLIIAFVLFVQYGLGFFFIRQNEKKCDERNTARFSRKEIYKISLTIILLLLGFIVPIMQLRPAPDSGREFHFPPSLGRFYAVTDAVVTAFIPIPQIDINFWGTKILYSLSRHKYLALFGIPLFIFTLYLLRKKPTPLRIYLFSSIGMFSLFLFISIGETRHYGFIYLMFIFALWISTTNNQLIEKNKNNNQTKFNIASLFLMIILIIHLSASIIAVYYELNYNFSNGKEAAQFLLKNNLINDQTIIAAYRLPVATSIMPYLPDTYLFYCLEYERTCRRVNEIGETRNLASIQEKIINFENTNYKNHWLILSNSSYIHQLAHENQYTFRASFENSIAYEDYYLYQFEKK